LDLQVWYNRVLLHLKKEYNLNNLYMELECDGKVNSHDSKTAEDYKKKECEYVEYAKDLSHKAYYCDVDIRNIETMKNYCDGYIWVVKA
jgi:hypothetical protein